MQQQETLVGEGTEDRDQNNHNNHQVSQDTKELMEVKFNAKKNIGSKIPLEVKQHNGPHKVIAERKVTVDLHFDLEKMKRVSQDWHLDKPKQELELEE